MASSERPVSVPPGPLLRILTGIEKGLREPARAQRFFSLQLKTKLFWRSRYERLREPKRMGPIPHDPRIQAALEDRLRASGIAVRDYVIDVDAFRQYVASGQYDRFRTYCGGGTAPNFAEKALEHYLAADVLRLTPSDVFIDVAAYDSPVSKIYGELYGCRTYSQDIAFPSGLHADHMGGDAAAMPVPDAFASAMALHCSFDHFEGDADIRFLREAARVLRPGGRVCIVPLYLNDIYAIQTDPITLAPDPPAFEDDATLFCARAWRYRFARFYDVPHFLSRFCANLSGLKLEILVVRNEKAIDDSCYAKFIALLHK